MRSRPGSRSIVWKPSPRAAEAKAETDLLPPDFVPATVPDYVSIFPTLTDAERAEIRDHAEALMLSAFDSLLEESPKDYSPDETAAAPETLPPAAAGDEVESGGGGETEAEAETVTETVSVAVSVAVTVSRTVSPAPAAGEMSFEDLRNAILSRRGRK